MSAVEVLAEQLDRIARVDSGLCSVVTVDAEAAQRRAEEADKALAAGEVWGPLHGVGVAPARPGCSGRLRHRLRAGAVDVLP
jgi:amidase